MSQFNTNAGGQGYDPVSAFSGMAGNPFANQNTRNARMGRRSTPTGMGGMQNVAMNAPPARPGPRRFFDQRTGGTMGITANYGSPVRSTAQPGGIGQQFANWDQALANAMGTDIRNQQGAMNQMYGANQQQIGLTEDALQRGIGTLQSVGVQQRDALGRIAGGLEQQGQQGYEEFKGFRDQQMGRVDQDIAAANQQAAAAVSGYEQTISKFQDTSAQDAANAAFGMRQSAKSQMAEIDMLDVSPGEKAALKQQLTQDIGNQVTQTVTGIYSNMNQQVANMGSNLAGLRMGQSQQTLAGGQLRGQMGTSFGAQTLDAQRMNQQMRELGANIRVAGEQSMASAMQQAVLFEMQGRQTVAEMIRQNPRQFVSMFAGLTGFLAGATTPGLGQISIPNFGAQA
jgi:hypothetical protein